MSQIGDPPDEEPHADRETLRLLHAAGTWIAGAIAEDPSGEPWLMTRTLLNEIVSQVDALGGWPPPDGLRPGMV